MPETAFVHLALIGKLRFYSQAERFRQAKPEKKAEICAQQCCVAALNQRVVAAMAARRAELTIQPAFSRRMRLSRCDLNGPPCAAHNRRICNQLSLKHSDMFFHE
jgi:hypothetical protein